MRNLLVKILGTMASFYTAQYLLAGFRIDSTWQAYLTAAIIFLVFNLLVSPLIKLLLLPINLLTLGLFRWLTQILVIYLFDLVYVGITISSFSFSGYSNGLFSLPAGNIAFFWTLCLVALVMSITYNLVVTLLQGDAS